MSKVTEPYLECMLGVARPVSRKEMLTNEKAVIAVRKEWDKLMGIKGKYNEQSEEPTFDMSVVRRWSEVAAEARSQQRLIHLARLFGFCVEKYAELDDNDPRQNIKYRVVVAGNKIVDQTMDAATFANLGAEPTTMRDGKLLDYYASLPGNVGGQADA